MKKAVPIRLLALILTIVLCLGMMVPVVAFAAEAESPAAEGTYLRFLQDLKTLEEYAESYTANPKKTAAALVINYIRTGVKKYTTDTWNTMAGKEITGFTEYVAQQDADNGTTASNLRNLKVFTTPNGLDVDFQHMFGAMDMASYNPNNADLGSWAGDMSDIIGYIKDEGVAGTVEEMTKIVADNYLGIDHENIHSFGIKDIRGDMDAYYLTAKISEGVSISQAVEAYYTADQTDADRAAYFLNNRFDGLKTQEDVRNAIFSRYKAVPGITILEADKGITSDALDMARKEACCNAFADYLFDLAGDRLTGETKPTEPEPTEPGPTKPEGDNPYYSVFSSNTTYLVPGVEQTIKFAETTDGKQIVYYVATVDVTREDLTIQAGYKGHDPSQGWGMARVTDQVRAAYETHTDPGDSENYIENFNVIVATNGDFYNMSSGCPSGALVMDGVQYKAGDKNHFFAILKDGTPVIGAPGEWSQYAGQVQDAIGASSLLVQNGELVDDPTGSYYGSRHSRTAVGITAAGKVVMMVLDGRQEPFSAGGSLAEIGQIMLDAGCVIAVNLDGGGSTTYVSKPEGSDSVKVINRPSDGFERSVSTSLMVVSTAKISNEFQRAVISSEYDYLTVGTQLELTATGVSGTGNAAQIPETVTWRSSDPKVATVDASGKVTAVAPGDVEIQLVDNTLVVGSYTLHVIRVPDALSFAKPSMNALYGVATPLNLIATYNGNPVAINGQDIWLEHSADTGVEFDGFNVICQEEANVRMMYIWAGYERNLDVEAEAIVTLYKDGEAIFDFENATSGDERFAWNRQVLNATTEDETLYQVTDPDAPMNLSYVFAIDMESVEVPEKLQPLMSLVAGGDVEGATAWQIMLQLAERVNSMTNVTVTLNVDKNLELDVSEIQMVNDVFKLTAAEYNPETGVLELKCNFIKQSQALDPLAVNNICIVSGIKATPSADAAWDANNQLTITNTGAVEFDIYLRANALYSFANQEANQKEYNVYPFVDSEVNPTYGAPDTGGHFSTSYVNFTDTFVLDKTSRQGWYNYDSRLYYFVDNVPLVGIHAVPSYDDPTKTLYYDFAEDGSMLSLHTGLIYQDGKVMYSLQGERRVGWQSVYDADGESYFYYFNPYTYAAVNGACNVEGYNYIFEDYKCIQGSLVKDSKGIRYRYAGLWQRNQWIELDGNHYYIKRDYYLATNGFHWIRTIDGTTEYIEHLFDENGVWQEDYTGIYNVGNDSYYLKNGIRIQEPGLMFIDGYYYYFASNAKAVKNCTYWISVSNGLLPLGPYKFDAQGRMINPPATEPEPTDPPVVEPTDPPVVEPTDPPVVEPTEPTPTEPQPTEPQPTEPVKDAIVSEYGILYYYKNGAIAYNAGLVKLADGSYIYVRSNGQLAIGNYWITKHNGLLPAGVYTFGADGKMVTESTEPSKPTDPNPTEPKPTDPPVQKNGIVRENGVLYYYKDNMRQYGAGLILIDGHYYYVRSNAQLATGRYWITHNNGLLASAMYTFDADGKMLNPPTGEEPTVKNGIVKENGVLYYYIDGIRAYGAGVIQLEDGAYIYVRSNGQLATGIYWPTTTNGLIPTKGYDWGTDGKLYL